VAQAAAGIIVIVLACGAMLSVALHSWRVGITPMPSSFKARRALIELLPLAEQPRLAAELGSGLGGVARLMADNLATTGVVGYEASTLPLMFSRLAPRPNLRFVRSNFMAADLGRFDLIYCYLCPESMVRLRPKLERELSPGAFVISNTFAISGWQAVRVIEVGDIYRSKIYVYAVATAANGSLQLARGGS